MKTIALSDVAGTVDTRLAEYFSPNNESCQSKLLVCRTTLTLLGYGGTTFVVFQNGMQVACTGELIKAVEIYNTIGA